MKMHFKQIWQPGFDPNFVQPPVSPLSLSLHNKLSVHIQLFEPKLYKKCVIAGYIIFISSVSICNDGSRRWESIPERPTTTCTLSLLFLPFCSPALFARPKMLTFFSSWPLISHLWRSNELSSFLFVRSLIYYQLCHQSWDFHLSESWLALVNSGQGILQVWPGEADRYRSPISCFTCLHQKHAKSKSENRKRSNDCLHFLDS